VRTTQSCDRMSIDPVERIPTGDVRFNPRWTEAGSHPTSSSPTGTPASNAGVASTSNRKRKRATPSTKTPSVGGFGPLSPGETATETSSPTPSPLPSRFTSGNRRNGATDVWPFACPLNSADEPPADCWPTEPISHATKPKTPWFGCKLCSEFRCAIYPLICRSLALTSFHHDRSEGSGPGRWKTFRNNAGSSPTSSFRHHLEDHHNSAWERERTRLGIPIRRKTKKAQNVPEVEPFTKEGLLKRLIKFVTGDDQVRPIHSSTLEDPLTKTAVNKCCQ